VSGLLKKRLVVGGGRVDGWMDGWRFHVFLEKQDKEGQHGLYETWGGGGGWREYLALPYQTKK
jgi:hypothetical protein